METTIDDVMDEDGFNFEDFMPYEANPKALRGLLGSMPIIAEIQGITTAAEAEKFLSKINNLTAVVLRAAG